MPLSKPSAASVLTGIPSIAAPWARRKDAKPKPRPQAISHRGYKAAFPENTMVAFRGAVEVGADAIETDLHLSRDGVVVLSHVGHSYLSNVSLIFFAIVRLTRLAGRDAEALFRRAP